MGGQWDLFYSYVELRKRLERSRLLVGSQP